MDNLERQAKKERLIRSMLSGSIMDGLSVTEEAVRAAVESANIDWDRDPEQSPAVIADRRTQERLRAGEGDEHEIFKQEYRKALSELKTTVD